MKFIFLLIAATSLLSCSRTLSISEYHYSRTGQTGREMFVVREDSTIYTLNGRFGNERKASLTSTETWNALNKASEKVDLKNLGNLKSPTNLRQTDAALFAKLYFVTKDSTYVSLDFDGSKAPEELMPVMEVFIEIMKKEK